MDRTSNVGRRRLCDCSLEEAAAGFTEGFAGYVVPVHVTAEALRLRIQREDIAPNASEVFFDGGRPAGILLVGIRGDRSRISALGVGPSIRRRGFGRQVMLDAIEAARLRCESRSFSKSSTRMSALPNSIVPSDSRSRGNWWVSAAAANSPRHRPSPQRSAGSIRRFEC
jgi:ribosomal protein S18 acetylase RimI-like enzyme